MNRFYKEGQESIFLGLGITKDAILRAPPRVAIPLTRRIGRWLSKYRPTWSGTKRFMVGEPLKFHRELRRGQAFAPGSLIRQSLHAPGLWQKGLFYGLPAYEAYHLMKTPGPGRAERLGGLLASTPVYLGTWKPFGMVGSMIAGGLAEQVGRGAGRLVSRAKPQKPPIRYPPSF